MKNIVIALLFSLITSVALASDKNVTPSRSIYTSLARILNVHSRADLEKVRDDLKGIEQLDCFKENRFVEMEGFLRITIDQESFNNYIYKPKASGFLEQLLWGNHAANSYQSRIPKNNFFNFPPSVWSTNRDGSIEMIVTANPDLLKSISRDDFKAVFRSEVEKIKTLVPNLKIECYQNKAHIDYARTLVTLLDASNCEEILSTKKQ